jgi:O-antigen/teichoic acid export membrane protein
MNKIRLALDRLGKKIGLNLPYLIKNGNWVSLRFLVLGLSGFLLSYFFARYSSKEVLGHYQLVLSILAIVSACSLSGLNSSALEAVVHGREGGVIRAVKLSFLSSLIGIPILIGIGAYYSSVQDQALLGKTIIAAAFLFPGFYALNTWSIYYEGKQQFAKASLRTILLNIVLTILLVSSIILHANVLILILLYLAINVIFQGFFIWEIFRKIQKPQDDFIDMRFGVSVSIQKFVSGLSGTLPPLIISFIFGVEKLALYYIAYFAIGALSSFLGNLISLYIPILFRGGKLDHKRIIINNIIVGIATWIIFILFLKYFFIRIYGQEYQNSLRLAYMISLLLVLTPLHTYLVNFFSTRRKNSLLVVILFLANALGGLVIFTTKSMGFLSSVSMYLYTLELITVIPLLGYYFLSHIKNNNQAFTLNKTQT